MCFRKEKNNYLSLVDSFNSFGTKMLFCYEVKDVMFSVTKFIYAGQN